MTHRNLIKYINTELDDRIAKSAFRIECYKSAIAILSNKVGAQPTKRELNKVIADLSTKLGTEVVGYVHDSMGKDWTIYIPSLNYQARLECKFYSVNAWGTGIFTIEKLEDFKKQLENDEQYLESLKAKKLNLSDIVDLLDNHDQQRAELDARLHREIEVFEAQCKVSLAGMDSLIKEAEKLKQNEERDEYYRQREKEFEARNS